MYHIEKEIKSQFSSITKTVDYISGRRDEISGFFDKTKIRFIGSGSSFYLAQSASLFFGLNNDGFDTYAVTAGDLLLNFDKYKDFFNDSIVVCLTRSGSTTELTRCLELLNDIECKKIAVCARKNAKSSALCDMNLEIEWAFDESVCQTQTVTNIYSACLAISAVISNNNSLIDELRSLKKHAEAFRENYEKTLMEIGENRVWNNAVTLADCECSGLLMEGALAFMEICQDRASFYNVLDVRHGPIVLIDEKTLVLVLVNANNNENKDLISDIKGRGAFCITAGMFADELGGDIHLELPHLNNISVAAVLAQYAIHIITLSRALEKGIDPDNPSGLNSWVELA